MKKLNEKEWRRFEMNNVFNIGHGFYNKKPPMSPNGTVPFVGASGINNGITGFCTMQAVRDNSKVGYGQNEPIERKLFDRGSICVVNNGSAIGYSYYQPKQFTCTHDVNPLTLRDHEVSEDEALFLSQMIREQGVCFIYARKWRPSRMVRSQFLLPVEDDGKPDYGYMAQYASEMRQGMLTRYKSYVAGRLSKLEYKDIPALDERQWKPFAIANIFSLVRGQESNMAMLKDGDVPLISAKNGSNGLKGFVERPKKLVHGGCITLNNDGDGGAGLAYYQPANMALDTHVTALIPKFEMSSWTMLFIAKCISGLHGFFGHGLSISNTRAKNIRVMLPIDDNGEPDYTYMEQYAKNMMLKKYKQYLAFLTRLGPRPQSRREQEEETLTRGGVVVEGSLGGS